MKKVIIQCSNKEIDIEEFEIYKVFFPKLFCFSLGAKVIIVDKDCDNWYYPLNLVKCWSFCKIKQTIEKAV